MREMPHELKESEFQATFSPPMQDVTKTTGEVVDLWAYADPVLLQTYPNSGTWEWCVKHIYESADGAFQHVFIPVPEDNVYLVNKPISSSKERRKIIAESVVDAVKISLRNKKHLSTKSNSKVYICHPTSYYARVSA